MSTTTAPPPPTDAPPPPDPSPPPFGRQRPPLRRSTSEQRIGGVASGLAEHLDLDPTLVRVAFVVAAVVSAGLALAAYAAAWLFLPDDQGGEPLAHVWYRRNGGRAAGVVGLVAIGLLGLAALRVLFAISWGWHPHHLGGLVVLGLVGILVAARTDPHARSRRRERRAHHHAGAPATGGTTADPEGDDPTLVADPTLTDATLTGLTSAGVPATRVAWSQPPDPELVRQRRLHRQVRSGTVLAAATSGLVAAVLWATGAWSVGGWVIPAFVLGCLGAGLVAAPWAGWSWTLALLAVVAAVALAVALVPGVSLRGGVGERIGRPNTVAEAEAATYRIGMGRQVVDLRGLDLRPGSVTRIHAGMGAGRLELRVPRDADVVLRGHLSAGVVRVDDDDPDVSGTDIDLDRTIPALASPSARIVVHVDGGFGEVHIDRAG